MSDTLIPGMEKPCSMCNDKIGMGAPPKPKKQVKYCHLIQFSYKRCLQSSACKMCLACKTCSAQMAPGQKYSVKLTDAELDSYKETFMMFDKVEQEDPILSS